MLDQKKIGASIFRLDIKSDRFLFNLGKLIKLVFLGLLACYVLAPTAEKILDESQLENVIQGINQELAANEGKVMSQSNEVSKGENYE